MRFLILRFLFVAVVVATPWASFAVETDVNAIKVGLARMFPDASFDSMKLRPSRIPGLLEAEVDTTVFYVTPDGKHVLMGDMINTSDQVNLTEHRRRTLVAKILDSIPEQRMIVMGPREARRTITVFTDVDCVYCRRLHNEDVPELTKQGVRVRYLLFPRQGPGSETYNRAVAVWCAHDRLKAVGDAKAGREIKKLTCPNPIDENLALGERLGVTGTPAIFLDDGKRLAGYMPAGQMLAVLGLRKQIQQPAAQ